MFSLKWKAATLDYWNKKQFECRKIVVGHHYGGRFFVLGLQHGRRDVTQKAVCQKPLKVKIAWQSRREPVQQHGGPYSEGYQHGEGSCDRTHYCRVSPRLLRYSGPSRGILLHRLCMLRHMDWCLGEFTNMEKLLIEKCIVSLKMSKKQAF